MTDYCTSGAIEALMQSAVAFNQDSALDLLLAKVCQRGKFDFTGYRRGTILRRLERRLDASGSRTVFDYMTFLDTHPEEYARLAEELTIKVSGFFRSPYCCQKVTELVLPEIVRRKDCTGKRQLRVWSTACARGEEPYSIAVMLAEFLGPRVDFDVTIHATDISQRALGAAQAGLYAPDEVNTLPPDILQRYFNIYHNRYEVIPEIRRMVRFAPFDLTSGVAPFANLDAIFCCNVLIYFQKSLQERVLNVLYDSLAAPGYLILGEVETPTVNLVSKLDCLDDKARIYRKSERPEEGK